MLFTSKTKTKRKRKRKEIREENIVLKYLKAKKSKSNTIEIRII